MKFEWKLFALVVILHLVLYGVFIGDAWVSQSLAKENQLNQQMFGDELSRSAVQRASAWFTSHFVDTGVQANSFTLFVPTKVQAENSKGLETMGNQAFSWFETRLRVLWALVYQSYIRVAVAALWFPYVLFLLVPWIVDGFTQRRIKQTNFDFTSPTRYSLSYHLIGLLGVVFFLLVFAPVPMPPQLTPVFLVTACFAIGLLSANVHKRI